LQQKRNQEILNLLSQYLSVVFFLIVPFSLQRHRVRGL
jgi:hypothetical protein